jgi:hypothetical protein
VPTLAFLKRVARAVKLVESFRITGPGVEFHRGPETMSAYVHAARGAAGGRPRFAKVTGLFNADGEAWTDFDTDGFVHHVEANPAADSAGTSVQTGVTIRILATEQTDNDGAGYRDLAAGDLIGYFPAPTGYRVPGAAANVDFDGVLAEHVGDDGAYQRPAGGGLANALFAVDLTEDGGSDGDASNPPNYTYTATSLDGNTTHGTGLTPKKQRVNGSFASGDGEVGLGYFDENENFQLYDANEVETLQSVCS